MKKRTVLILIMLLLIVLIVFIFGFLIKNIESNDLENNAFEENRGTVFNQGQSVLSYQDNIYLIDNLSSSIVRYNTETGSSYTVSKFNNYSFNDNMYIKNNNLIYSIDDATYFINLDTMKNQKFMDGRLVYINDRIAMYVVQDFSLQNLYITSYDSSTFRKTNEVFYNLAKGYNINYLRESNGLIFFSSVNLDNSTSLFSVDLESFEVTLIVRDSSYTSDTTRGEIVDAVKCGDEIFYTIAKFVKTTNEEYISNYDLYSRPIDGAFTEIVRSDVMPNLITDNTGLIYGKFNSELNKVEWNSLDLESTIENWTENIQGDISRYFAFEDLKIYINGNELQKLEGDYIDYKINYAMYCDGYIYILLEKDTSHVWYSSKADGSEFNKIYEIK